MQKRRVIARQKFPFGKFPTGRTSFRVRAHPCEYRTRKKKYKRTKNKSSFAELSSNASTPEEKEFYQMMLDNCPRVCQMEEPLTYYEYQRIVRQGIPLATIRHAQSGLSKGDDNLQ